jgi:RNA polymerase sigma factor (sigma-70 family)
MNGLREFEQFVAAQSPTLLRTAILLCSGDVGAAEELVQDVLARMYPKWRRFRGHPEAYARAALANAAIDRWRRRSRRVTETPLVLVSAPVVAGPEQSTVDRAGLLSALATLPARMRAVLVLRFFDDLPCLSGCACRMTNVGSSPPKGRRSTTGPVRTIPGRAGSPTPDLCRTTHGKYVFPTPTCRP